MNRILKFLALFVVLEVSLSLAYIPGVSQYPSQSHGGGLYGNPASLSAFDSPGWLFGYQEDHQETQDLQIGLHGESWGASFLWLNGPKGFDHSEWALISAGPNPNRSFFTGQRLAIVRTSHQKGNSYLWSPGFLWRPTTFGSLGFYSQSLLQGGPYQPRIQHLGASLKPFEPLTLSWSAQFQNKTQLSHFQDQVSQSLLFEFTLSGLDLGLTVPLNDPHDNQFWGLQVALPLGPYHSVAFGGERRQGENTLSSIRLGGHSARSPNYWKPLRVVRVPLGGRIAEIEPGFSLLGSSATGLATLRNHFTLLHSDASANPILFDFSGYTAGPAAALEIRRGIQSLKIAGKKTIAFVNDLRPSVMMAAGAADQVVLQPSARVDFRGISSEVLYYKGFLDWIGVKAEFLRHGRYKSATEPYTADSMSQEARSDLSHLLHDWWGIFRDSIAVSRNLHPDTLEQFTHHPAITATAAHQAQLVDTVLYLDDVPSYALKQFFNVDASPLMVDWEPSSEVLFTEDWTPRPQIAVLNIEGTIIDGPGGTDRLSGTSMAGSAELMTLIDQIRKEGNYQALILRINSPGGSALASDEVWHRLRKLAADGMPIIASIGDMAASGGYYLACAADDIIAEPTSIVGSIGIFGGKVDISGLLAKLRLRSETVATHPSANAQSFSRSFSESEKEALQAYMDDFYGRFVRIVADARQLDSLKVDSLGEGRIYTAAEGLKHGLVDDLGGFSKAIALAKKRAGIAPHKPIELVPLLGNSSLSFRNLSDQARLVPWRQSLEKSQIWSIWLPEFKMVE